MFFSIVVHMKKVEKVKKYIRVERNKEKEAKKRKTVIDCLLLSSGHCHVLLKHVAT